MQKYRFKLKGTGPITFHLGMDGTLCTIPRKCIEHDIDPNHECNIFRESPKQVVMSSQENGDHPEDLLYDEGSKNYQSRIGAIQRAISKGSFDVATAVMNISGYRVAPRKGHFTA